MVCAFFKQVLPVELKPTTSELKKNRNITLTRLFPNMRTASVKFQQNDKIALTLNWHLSSAM